MLHHLRKKLTLLYTFTTGCILTAVVLILAAFTQQYGSRQQEDLFNRQLMTIANKLQYDSKISQKWLSSLELENRLIVHIEENNTPLLYYGSFAPATGRSKLIEKARELALEESIDTSLPPISTDLNKSSLLSIPGDHGDIYQGTVLLFTAKNSYFSLILIEDITSLKKSAAFRRLLFLAADVLGILLFMLVSWYFVGKSLQPIRENEKKQHAFIAAASHELRSPLAVIQASADAIGANAANTDRFLSNIKNECSRMSRLVQDMLLLASAKSSAWSLQKEDVDMDTLLLTLMELYEPVCQKKNLTLVPDLPEDSLPAIYGDRERISHILSILLDNAVSYSPENQSITLGALANRQCLICRVIDHGPGIPDPEKEKVFTYFYRSDSSRKDKNHFGLGLCVAAELTKLSGCELQLFDTPGGGCSFSLVIPLR